MNHACKLKQRRIVKVHARMNIKLIILSYFGKKCSLLKIAYNTALNKNIQLYSLFEYPTNTGAQVILSFQLPKVNRKFQPSCVLYSDCTLKL